MAKVADIYFQIDPWKVKEEGFDPAHSRVSESIFSLGNESIGVRGFFDEGGSVDSLRGCYTNGVYDIVSLPRSYRGIVDRTHFSPRGSVIRMWLSAPRDCPSDR